MKEKNIILTEMNEKKSKFGNTYFIGFSESGSKFILKKIIGKKSNSGDNLWELSIN